MIKFWARNNYKEECYLLRYEREKRKKNRVTMRNRIPTHVFRSLIHCHWATEISGGLDHSQGLRVTRSLQTVNKNDVDSVMWVNYNGWSRNYRTYNTMPRKWPRYCKRNKKLKCKNKKKLKNKKKKCVESITWQIQQHLGLTNVFRPHDKRQTTHKLPAMIGR